MGIDRLTSITALCLLLAQQTLGNLTGSGTITYHDFQSLPMNLLVNNPPSCGMPYAQLDVTRITAVQQMNKATDCGQCIKVCNADDTSKFVYVLAVDTGGRGLDLSKPSFGKLFNIDDGVGPAQWEPVGISNCAGIWSNGPQNSNDNQNADVDTTPATTVDNKPVVTEQPAVSSPPAAEPTPSQVPVVSAPPPPPPSSDQSTIPPSVSRTSSTLQQPITNSETAHQVAGSANNEAVEVTVPEDYSSEISESLELEGVPHDAGNSLESLLDEEDYPLSEDSESSNGLTAFSPLSTLLFGTLMTLSTVALSV